MTDVDDPGDDDPIDPDTTLEPIPVVDAGWLSEFEHALNRAIAEGAFDVPY
jgi:hypothetical protein